MKKIEFQDLTELEVDSGSPIPVTPEVFKDVNVTLQVVVGDVELSVEECEGLRSGKVIRLNQPVDEPVRLVLNGNVIALGELVADGDYYAIRITQLG